MDNMLHATFTRAEDGIRAVEFLLHQGARSEDINLILPQRQHKGIKNTDAVLEAAEITTGSHSASAAVLPAAAAEAAANRLLPQPPQLRLLLQHRLPRYEGDGSLMAPNAPGYTYDALGAVIPDTMPTKTYIAPIGESHEAALDAKEGAGLGLLFGVLTAACIPGIGLGAGSGTLVVGLLAAATGLGGLAAGIYGYLRDRQIDHEVARKVSDHLLGGGTTLSVSVSGALNEAEIACIFKRFGGQLIQQP